MCTGIGCRPVCGSGEDPAERVRNGAALCSVVCSQSLQSRPASPCLLVNVMQGKEGGLPVVLHERPGHLMLTSAFHDLTDIARLELQPLRSTTTSSSEPEEATPWDSKAHNASCWRSKTPGRFDQSESAASEDKEAGGDVHQQGRIRSKYNALHNGRNDSAADFGVTHAPSSSGLSSLAVSACDSEESELLSIREQGPDQAVDGHSLAVDSPDHDHISHNSSSSCATGRSSTSVSVNLEQRSSVFEQAASALPHPSPKKMNGSLSRTWVTEHSGMHSARPSDAEHCSSSMPAAPHLGQPGRQPCLESRSSLPGRAQRQGFSELYKGAARWCRGVPWSQVGLLPELLRIVPVNMQHGSVVCSHPGCRCSLMSAGVL